MDSSPVREILRSYRESGLESSFGPSGSEDLGLRASTVRPGHFLGHVKQEPAVAFLDSTEEPAEAGEDARVFPRASPGRIARAGMLRKLQRFGWGFPLVEELVERH